MSTLNFFRLASGMLSLSLFLCLYCCNPNTNSNLSTAKPCPCPQPLVSFFEAGGFLLNPDTLAGATSVTVYVTNAQGAPLDTLELTPGQDTALVYDLNISRPLHLRLVYKSSTGEVLGEACLQVDDSGGNGIVIPDVDVIMGFTSSPPPSCADLTNTQVGSGTGQVTFEWVPDILYEIRFFPPNETTKKLRLKTTDMPGDLPGITRVYNKNGYGCLDSLSMQNPQSGGVTNTKVLQVTVSSNWDYTITGTDNNVQNSPREIKIVGPSGWTIEVWK